MMRRAVLGAAVSAAMAALLTAACGGNKPPVAKPMPPPADAADAASGSRPPSPPEPVPEPADVPPEPVRDDAIRSASLDDLNRNSPMRPVFYDYDSAEVSPAGKAALDENATLLKKYPTWVVTVEGHCDERGSAEYNLALGERRAVAARTYLVSQGIAADRLRVVSYGKEFPFDPGHDEAAWAKNRRAHFVITAQ